MIGNISVRNPADCRLIRLKPYANEDPSLNARRSITTFAALTLAVLTFFSEGTGNIFLLKLFF
jgi:hypothetical protein